MAKVRAKDPETFDRLKYERRQNWYQLNPERGRAIAKKTRDKLRQEFLNAYGNRCTCCGEAEPAFLTVEHLARDGHQHRSRVGGDSTSVLRDL